MSAVKPADDQHGLEQLEHTVRAELLDAETSRLEPPAEGAPAVGQVPDTDAERYEAALDTLLGAVEALEDAAQASGRQPDDR